MLFFLRIHFQFTMNSLFFARFHFRFNIFSEMTLKIHYIFANSLRIHYHLGDSASNSLSFPRIHFLFTIYCANSIRIHYLFRESTIHFATSLLIHYFFTNSLSVHFEFTICFTYSLRHFFTKKILSHYSEPMRGNQFGRWLCPIQSAIRISMTQNLQFEKVS